MTCSGMIRVLRNGNITINDYQLELTSRQINQIPSKSGVYGLCYGKKVQYIGKSNDLYRRINEHNNQREISFGIISWFDIHHMQLDLAEKLLIRYYKPPHNDVLKY